MFPDNHFGPFVDSKAGERPKLKYGGGQKMSLKKWGREGVGLLHWAGGRVHVHR